MLPDLLQIASSLAETLADIAEDVLVSIRASVDEVLGFRQCLCQGCSVHRLLYWRADSSDVAVLHLVPRRRCRFLPDKAIDLIDEAGSRVRLRHAQLPEEARDLDKELRALLKEKDAAVRCLQFGLLPFAIPMHSQSHFC